MNEKLALLYRDSQRELREILAQIWREHSDCEGGGAIAFLPPAMCERIRWVIGEPGMVRAEIERVGVHSPSGGRPD